MRVEAPAKGSQALVRVSQQGEGERDFWALGIFMKMGLIEFGF